MTAQPPILVVDLETTSDNRLAAGIVEIGAIWLHPAYGAREGMWFEMKCRPREDSEVDPAAISVNGCDWLEDPTVAPESEAVERFVEWIARSLHMAELSPGSLIMAGMNVGVFDWIILRGAWTAARSPASPFPFSFRTLDLHAVALIEALRNGIDDIPSSGMKSSSILDMCGLPAEPKPHRALCGALLEHRALWELLTDEPPPAALGELESRFFPQPA